MSDASTGLGRTAARGAAVSLGGQFLRVLLQMASVVILARLLAPKDYGLLAMATVVVGVAEIFRDFGLSAAAIQARSLSTAQRDTLFWINTAIGAFLTVLIAASAPLLADLYDQPQLIGIVQVLSVIFLLNGATTQYRVALTRELRFRALVAVDVVAPAVGLLTAIFLALAQAGYWALVAQQIAQAGTLLLGVAICARWLPGRPRRRTGVRSMLRFGGTMVGTQLIGYAGNNVDSLILGLREGPVILGLYNRAFQLVMTPFNQVRAPITQVALPVFSKLQDEPARFDAFLVRGQLALGYGLAVPLALVAGASVPVTELFLGDKWMPIAPAVSCLAAAAIFQLLAYVGYWVYVSRGLTGQLLRYSVVSAVIRITCVLVGSQWGLYGVAVGYAVAPALAWPVSLWWLGRCTRLPTAALYAGAGRVLLVCGVTGPAAWAFSMWTSHWPSVAALALVLLVAVALVATFLLLPGHRRDATDLRTTIRLVTSRR